MSTNLFERGIEGDNLLSLAKQRFDLELLPPDALIDVLDRVISNGRVNKLGQEYLVDCIELIQLGNASNVLVADSLEEARDYIGMVLTEMPDRIGYITGGLEGLHLQVLLHSLTGGSKVSSFIFGLETDSYIVSKGRGPLYTTNEKVSLWEQLAPDKSVLFIIPQRPGFISPDDYYDWIVQYLGLYRNKQVVYLGSKDDPQEVILAHQRRAASPAHCLQLSLGNLPLHTSELLVKI